MFCFTVEPPVPDDVGEATVIEVPVQSVVVLSTTYLPHFAALDRVDTLVGISDTTIAQTPAVVERVKQQKIRDVSRNQVVNVEAILNLNPDIVITFDAGGVEFGYGANVGECWLTGRPEF